ncbi:proline--tRNA ligase [Acidiferrimicrobium sp. IK]|uniref:proline--tRNA ligase n=1 Tax=Acidiferrimicrobium sp. IK TaxID=2871700 RepID=UPI0021CB0B9A|nr:proline--tRNA ligase [Acidiferrimicrobium sp. IK]MCU4183749.1 proline--tRNA ligase [Acidiferrimicrobium sp. IK]
MASPLTPRATDFPRWYQDVIARAELADNGPVRGTMVIRPWGYAIWERLQAEMDRRIKDAGAENAYFPLFIPQSYLQREAEHVEGFSPELAVVTHGGGKQLEEPVVVRPTSETVINSFIAKWVQSYRDLPLLVNQWANVVRWELRPRLFLRTSEFLWQEGHTAHATEADARAYALQILNDVYLQTMVDVLAIPVLIGHKTARERFAGATQTWTCEGMMGDGKALQMGTSHELGQNFAKAFGIQFSDETGAQQYAWQTSWGASTRMIGALIMAHGDDRGLRLPPALAPVEVIVLVIRDDEAVRAAADALVAELRAGGHRVRLDARTDVSFGRRAVDWELKGVPVRVEVGPRDLAEGNVTLVRRDNGTKRAVPLAGVASEVAADLVSAQADLLSSALAQREARTTVVASIEDVPAAAEDGFAVVPWELVGASGEATLAASGLSVRCLQRPDGSLATDAAPDDGGTPEPGLRAVVAKAY